MGFFAQVHGDTRLPYKLGEEDKISLRLDPMDLGALAFRSGKINNMTIPAAVVVFQTTGNIWRGNDMDRKLLEKIQEVVSRNPQSREEEDQKLQKKLFWGLAKALPSSTRMGEFCHVPIRELQVRGRILESYLLLSPRR